MKKLLLLLLIVSVNSFADTFDEDKNFVPKDNDVPLIYEPVIVKWFKNSVPDVVYLQKLQNHKPIKNIHRYSDYSRFDEHPCEYDIWPEGFICIEPNPRIVYEEELPELKKPVGNVPEPSIMAMLGIYMILRKKKDV